MILELWDPLCSDTTDPDSPLTPREKEYASQNQGLLNCFLRDFGLDEELYGPLAVRYVTTVRRYLRDRKLQTWRLSTVVWLHLRSALSHERRKELHSPRTVPLDAHPEALVYRDDHRLLELSDLSERTLTDRERELLRLRACGFSCREISERTGTSARAAAERLSRIRKKLRNE